MAIADSDVEKITVAHSMPQIVDPEIEEPTTWTVEYAIPFAVLKNYCDIIKPESGAVWHANFYKCADETSHPHWITWAHVDTP